MSDKTEKLLSLRPHITSGPAENAVEQFQNTTLRPILKLQNEMLIRVFQSYIIQRKNVFRQLTVADRKAYISNALTKDPKFGSLLKGLVIGLFTDEEWTKYVLNEAEINRRLSNLIEQRLLSNMADV